MDFSRLIACPEWETLSGKQAFLGLDGFVDEIFHVVAERNAPDKWRRELSMAAYGSRIVAASGLNLNIEMIPVRRKIGGNGVILANALLQAGVSVTYLGTCGSPAVNPEYADFFRKARVISLGAPAQTDAIEFLDGKIINSQLKNLDQVRWDSVQDILPADTLVSLISNADLLGFGNWTMLMHMSDIWKHLLSDILPAMRPKDRKPLFIDLADPSKRSREDIQEALRMLTAFQAYLDVTLSLNRKEAMLLGGLLDIKETLEPLALAGEIRKALQISRVIIHTARGAWSCNCDGDSAEVSCPPCRDPVQMTGAGDNFNAGASLGLLMKRSEAEMLALGTACAGSYIREAESPDIPQIKTFLSQWMREEMIGLHLGQAKTPG